MKKAVIKTGGKQYLVTQGEEYVIERLKDSGKTVQFTPLLIVDGDKISVGKPTVEKAVVKAEIVEELKADKVTSIRYKAKKRVKKVHGHRQIQTKIKITSTA